ncbi:helix-turn-helix transcriptional regulator [Spirillospora sp. NPDC047279]|uniref:helix-turn-helix domain-containing protein n=1 Tax=Spirillospora sp. NPDC047279 TaxID=3155478 RepID=UPI0033CA6D39
MAPGTSPSVRFRRIGRTLRELREEANRSLRTAGRDLDRSPSNLSMIENGLQPIRPRDLAQILDYYGVEEGPVRQSLLHLAEQGREKDWTRAFQGRVSLAAQDFASLERDSARLRSFQPGRVPGLMQTEAYARAVMAAAPPDTAQDEAGLVGFRMNRQRILDNASPPRYEAVIGESALYQRVGSDAVMSAQLSHLARQARREHITVRVLPFSAGSIASYTGSFEILELDPPGRLMVVVVEDLTRLSFREQDDEVNEYDGYFSHIWAAALDNGRSLTLIEEIASRP